MREFKIKVKILETFEGILDKFYVKFMKIEGKCFGKIWETNITKFWENLRKTFTKILDTYVTSPLWLCSLPAYIGYIPWHVQSLRYCTETQNFAYTSLSRTLTVDCFALWPTFSDIAPSKSEFDSSLSFYTNLDNRVPQAAIPSPILFNYTTLLEHWQ